MNDSIKNIMIRLQEPFPSKDIEWRVSRAGEKNNNPWAMVLAYVTNRAIQERLDSIFSCFGWRNEYKEGPQGGVICGISVKFDDEWVTKWDGAENTAVESIKGGLSGSMKRAAVQWGIGRYLYNLTENFAIVSAGGKHRDSFKDKSGKKVFFKWDPPTLPSWALPETVTPKKKTGEEIKAEEERKAALRKEIGNLISGNDKLRKKATDLKKGKETKDLSVSELNNIVEELKNEQKNNQ